MTTTTTTALDVARQHLARAEERLAKYGSSYSLGKVEGLRYLVNELEELNVCAECGVTLHRGKHALTGEAEWHDADNLGSSESPTFHDHEPSA